jgi:hypothetical protein
MAVLKYYNTTTSAWEYIAASTTANFTTWKKTMSGGETSVSGTDDNAVTLSYTVGLEQVFINGVLQVRGSDYTATTGTSVTGLTALVASDIVTVVCYAPFNVANTIAPTLVDAKGDLIAGTAADTVGRLPVGSANNILATDSTASTGLKWIPFNSATSTVDASVNNPAGTAYAASAGTDPAVTITTGTKALIIVSARIFSPGGNFNFVSYDVSGATTLSANDNKAISSNIAGGYPMFSGMFLETGLTAGSNTFTMRYKCNVTASGSYDLRKITVVALP